MMSFALACMLIMLQMLQCTAEHNVSPAITA
jgi:hypothetical protein